MKRQLRDANENRITGREAARSGEHCCERLQNEGGSAILAAESVRDGDENNGTERGGCERVQKAAAENSQLGENPATEVRPDQSQDNVRDAAEAAAASNLSRKPSGYQAKE
jgi:hypothetical protein